MLSGGASTRIFTAAAWAEPGGEAWAVGTQQLPNTHTATATLHWDGREWSRGAAEPDAQLFGVWGASADDVWAVGIQWVIAYDEERDFGIIRHWDGLTWTAVTPPTEHPLRRVWSSGPDDAWAVGGAEGRSPAGVIVHWDGSRWEVAATDPDFKFTAISGTGPDDVWVATQHVRYDRPNRDGSFVTHWDGKSWSPFVVGPLWEPVVDVFAAAPGDAWALMPSRIVRWDGQRWRDVTPPTMIADPHSLYAIGGSGPDDVWVSGVSQETSHASVFHWDGTDWTELPVEIPGIDLLSVGPGAVWLVTGAGGLLRNLPAP